MPSSLYDLPSRSPSADIGTVPAALPEQCDLPWVRRYVALHSDIMRGRAPVKETRYLLMRPHAKAGLGNRLRAIFGALSFAVLTNRALLLDFGSRSNGTEVDFFTPAFVDWRFPDRIRPKRLSHLRTGQASTTSRAYDSESGEDRGVKYWAHRWSPFVDADLAHKGDMQHKFRRLRRDDVVTVWNNKEDFFQKAEPADLWPNTRVVVMASQNHDLSTSLLLNPKVLRNTCKLWSPLNASFWGSMMG